MDLQSANRRALNTDSSLYTQSGVAGPLETIVFERVVGSLASTIPAPGGDDLSVHWSGSEGTRTVHDPSGSEGETLTLEEVR